MTDPKQILEWGKSEMLGGIKYHFDYDKKAKTDTLNINSTEDIIYFIKWIQNNS